MNQITEVPFVTESVNIHSARPISRANLIPATHNIESVLSFFPTGSEYGRPVIRCDSAVLRATRLSSLFPVLQKKSTACNVVSAFKFQTF
jgi:hypothetical protein